ncbi:hypothetical protein CQA53_00635 [Helicobacter didelphidarum]|uniref:Outer membrane beta-barrel protein n=1 Tax=Helicobacter didelphidarum TaxID=2040648 RepID=A0A3D8IQI8_9HELI|nr:outer membrane beta-barrel protein [Helicobacter didelphidarum]RDU67557.1 hypothetical protein CQA53_00635 [Helicobacter didelphidarum]
MNIRQFLHTHLFSLFIYFFPIFITANEYGAIKGGEDIQWYDDDPNRIYVPTPRKYDPSNHILNTTINNGIIDHNVNNATQNRSKKITTKDKVITEKMLRNRALYNQQKTGVLLGASFTFAPLMERFIDGGFRGGKVKLGYQHFKEKNRFLGERFYAEYSYQFNFILNEYFDSHNLLVYSDGLIDIPFSSSKPNTAFGLSYGVCLGMNASNLYKPVFVLGSQFGINLSFAAKHRVEITSSMLFDPFNQELLLSYALTLINVTVSVGYSYIF